MSSTTKKDDKKLPINHNDTTKTNEDDEFDRLARQMLLDEAKRNKIRAETQGALGWLKPTLVTNRRFLRNTLISNAVHNIHKNEQEKQQRIQSTRYRKRSCTPTSTKCQRNDDKTESSSKSKRTKK